MHGEEVNLDTIYLDFAKAFDKADYGIAAHRMKEIGIDGKLGIWLYSFLTDQTQEVIANNEISDKIGVKSGVPQGSILGPVIFLIMIDSITKLDEENYLDIFADDTKVSVKVSTETEASKVQDLLDKLYEWAIENNMEFNGDKLECLKHGKQNDLMDSYEYLQPKYSGAIQETLVIRDLGIIISRNGDFSEHINMIS